MTEIDHAIELKKAEKKQLISEKIAFFLDELQRLFLFIVRDGN